MELLEGTMQETLGSESVFTKLERIAKLAKDKPEAALTTLAHHMDLEWLREAHRRTRKDGAVGVDGETSEAYAAHLEENLRSLLERAKSGTYRAPPVRRVHIPKGDGEQSRPIGIPTFEDKVLQRAVHMVLEAVYEQDFLDCSYGFRPGRSAHQMLADLQHQTVRMAGGWILEVDIKKFFDTLDHKHLREILQQRVRDGVLLRLIGKWLNAGVLEAGVVHHPEEGTPQGGVISPLLANLYLHEVLDAWFYREVRPRLKGPSFLFRYADDFVILFSQEEDARRVLNILPKRFGRYGLTLHPEKTRLVEFRRPGPRPWGGEGKEPGSFELLGFNHHWARSRAGKWFVRRTTSKSRFSRAVKSVVTWCRRNRHRPIQEQWQHLKQMVRGHYGYYGIPGNSRGLSNFYCEVRRRWQKWLNRRSQRRNMSWARMLLLLERFPLPQPKLMTQPA
jgi:group II intron reverse transcriptase/maturase